MRLKPATELTLIAVSLWIVIILIMVYGHPFTRAGGESCEMCGLRVKVLQRAAEDALAQLPEIEENKQGRETLQKALDRASR